MSSAVLDASALLALANNERGGERVAEALAAGAAIGTVNLSEAVAKLVRSGMAEARVRRVPQELKLRVFDFDEDLAYRTALLEARTRPAGLSLGDRACLALAQRLGLPALTADRSWQDLGLDVSIEIIR